MRILILSTACLALVACGDSGSVDADGDGTITGEEVAAAASGMDKPEPGRWEVTSEVVELDIPGMPPEMKDMAKGMFANMFASTNYCLTPEQADQDPASVWKETQGDCTWERFDMNGNDVDAKAVCTDPQGGTATMTMTGTHSATAYDAENEMVMETPEGQGLVKVRVSGRHVGECDGSEAG